VDVCVQFCWSFLSETTLASGLTHSTHFCIPPKKVPGLKFMVAAVHPGLVEK
jgi:hypothetical protein